MQKRLAGRADLRLNVAQFKKAHLDPLEAAGFIRQEKTTVGRGGRPMRFEATPLFHEQVVQRLIEQARQAGTEMPEEALQVPMSELLDRMRSPDRDIKGKALEHFALRLLLRLGLQEIRWRHRAANAEEIDGMAISFSPVHSRWQVQCKNTAQLDVEDAAKEVGIAVRQRSTTVLLVTTGEFTPGATNYIDDIVRRSPYTMLRFNGTDVQAIARDPGAIWELLRREALRADELRKQ
jgi:site-specific DNA-methyltransferase (cytosine-N4-specific)